MTEGWVIKEELDHQVDAVIDAGECGTEPRRWSTLRRHAGGHPGRGGDPSPFE